MKRPLRALAAAGLLAAGSIVAVALGGTASADTQICEQFGSTTIQGRYVVQNNRWGTSASSASTSPTPASRSPRQTASAPPTARRCRTRRSSSAATTPTARPAPTCRCRSARSAARPAASRYNYVSGATYNAVVRHLARPDAQAPTA